MSTPKFTGDLNDLKREERERAENEAQVQVDGRKAAKRARPKRSASG
jgi:hypothetical protein